MTEPIEHVEARLAQLDQLTPERIHKYSYRGSQAMATPAAILNYGGIVPNEAFASRRAIAMTVRVQLVDTNREKFSKLVGDVVRLLGSDPKVIDISGGDTVPLGSEVKAGSELKNAVMADIQFVTR